MIDRRWLRVTLWVLALLSTLALQCRAAGWSTMLLFAKQNIVVVGSSGSSVRAVDVQSGAQRWKRSPESAAAVDIFEHGDDAVLVYQSRIKVSKLNDAKRDAELNIEAVNVASGETRYHYRIDGAMRGHPQKRDNRLVLDYDTKAEPKAHVMCLDLDSGQRAWVRDLELIARKTDKTTLYGVVAAKENVQVIALDLATGADRFISPACQGEYKAPLTLVDGAVVLLTKLEGSQRCYGITSSGQIAYVIDLPAKSVDEVKVFGKYLFTRSDDGKRLTVYDAIRGAQLWTVVPKEAEADKGECTSTTIEGDTLYTIAVAPPQRFSVLAFDAASGRPLAHADAQGKPESGLTVLGDKVLLGAQMTEAQVQAINRPAPPQPPTPGPDSGTRKDDEDEKKPHVLLCLDGKSLQPRWSVPVDAAVGESPISEEGDMLMLQSDTQLIALDPRAGKSLWKSDVDLGAGPVFANGRLIYGDNELRLLIVDTANPDHVLHTIRTKPFFNWDRLPNLVFVVVIVGLILFFIARARGGQELFIRRLAGLNALDEAVGRATEMGKPVLYVCGTQDVDEIETLAGLSILGHVARRAAEYETPLLVPTSRSVVMTTAQEVVREAHFKAGRPDSFIQDNVRYLTDDQFGFVAGVDGIMMREKPAANFYLGMFFGESLILAETGHATGAIQIAGTAQAAQLPFFVAACDYTLMGEELFAASAYLSRDPREVGSLKGQDYAKALIMVVILGSCLLYPWWPEVKTWLSQ